MRGSPLPVLRGEPRLPRWASAWLRASPAVVSHAWRVLQPRRQRELPRRTCPRPAPCRAGWPSTGRPRTPGRAACAACGPGATRITHGPTAGTRTCAPRRPRAIRIRHGPTAARAVWSPGTAWIRHGPTAARAAWRAGTAGVMDGAAARPCATTARAARGPGAGRATAGTPRPPCPTRLGQDERGTDAEDGQGQDEHVCRSAIHCLAP
jgi:hypothetical protein